MEEFLKNFEISKVIIFFAPGAAFAVFRSFAIRGSFPSLSKDDLGAVVIASAIYTLLVRLITIDFSVKGEWEKHSAIFLIFALLIVPALLGFGSGFIEASDRLGKIARALRIRLPSPDDKAWDTVFREMPVGSVLIFRLQDSTVVTGRWLYGSATSQKSDKSDLFISEIGALTDRGVYTPFVPVRGTYFSPGEIRFIEVVKPPRSAVGVNTEASGQESPNGKQTWFPFLRNRHNRQRNLESS